MTKLEKFKKSVSPRKRVSKLNQHEDEIQDLLNNRYTHQQICEYLLEAYNVEVSRQYLSSYIKSISKIKKVQNHPQTTDSGLSQDTSDEEQEKEKRNAELSKYFAKFKK